MTRNVVEHGLNYVRLHAEVGHASRSGTPQIVQRPMLDWLACFSDVGVKLGLGSIPTSKARIIATEDIGSMVTPKLIQYRLGSIAQRDAMCPTVLCALWRQDDLFVLDLIPAQRSNLALALPS